MNTGSKTSLIVALAFILGGASGFFIAKKLLEEHYREISQMEIDDVIEYYQSKIAEQTGGSESEEEELEEETNNYRKIANNYKKPDLHELAQNRRRPTEDDFDDEDEEFEDDFDVDVEGEEFYDEEDDEEEIEFSKEEDEQEMDSPRIILYSEFTNPDNTFEKIDLFYYRFDDVMCTVNDVVVESPEDELGWDWMVELKRKTTVFVRNDDLKKDYEIHSLSKSYQDEVSSKLETDKERQFRRLARQKEAMDAFSAEYEEEKPRRPKTEPYERQPKIRYDNLDDPQRHVLN